MSFPFDSDNELLPTSDSLVNPGSKTSIDADIDLLLGPGPSRLLTPNSAVNTDAPLIIDDTLPSTSTSSVPARAKQTRRTTTRYGTQNSTRVTRYKPTTVDSIHVRSTPRICTWITGTLLHHLSYCPTSYQIYYTALDTDPDSVKPIYHQPVFHIDSVESSVVHHIQVLQGVTTTWVLLSLWTVKQIKQYVLFDLFSRVSNPCQPASDVLYITPGVATPSSIWATATQLDERATSAVTWDHQTGTKYKYKNETDVPWSDTYTLEVHTNVHIAPDVGYSQDMFLLERIQECFVLSPLVPLQLIHPCTHSVSVATSQKHWERVQKQYLVAHNTTAAFQLTPALSVETSAVYGPFDIKQPVLVCNGCHKHIDRPCVEGETCSFYPIFAINAHVKDMAAYYAAVVAIVATQLHSNATDWSLLEAVWCTDNTVYLIVSCGQVIYSAELDTIMFGFMKDMRVSSTSSTPANAARMWQELVSSWLPNRDTKEQAGCQTTLWLNVSVVAIAQDTNDVARKKVWTAWMQYIFTELAASHTRRNITIEHIQHTLGVMVTNARYCRQILDALQIVPSVVSIVMAVLYGVVNDRAQCFTKAETWTASDWRWLVLSDAFISVVPTSVQLIDPTISSAFWMSLLQNEKVIETVAAVQRYLPALKHAESDFSFKLYNFAWNICYTCIMNERDVPNTWWESVILYSESAIVSTTELNRRQVCVTIDVDNVAWQLVHWLEHPAQDVAVHSATTHVPSMVRRAFLHWDNVRAEYTQCVHVEETVNTCLATPSTWVTPTAVLQAKNVTQDGTAAVLHLVEYQPNMTSITRSAVREMRAIWCDAEAIVSVHAPRLDRLNEIKQPTIHETGNMRTYWPLYQLTVSPALRIQVLPQVWPTTAWIPPTGDALRYITTECIIVSVMVPILSVWWKQYRNGVGEPDISNARLLAVDSWDGNFIFNLVWTVARWYGADTLQPNGVQNSQLHTDIRTVLSVLRYCTKTSFATWESTEYKKLAHNPLVRTMSTQFGAWDTLFGRQELNRSTGGLASYSAYVHWYTARQIEGVVPFILDMVKQLIQLTQVHHEQAGIASWPAIPMVTAMPSIIVSRSKSSTNNTADTAVADTPPVIITESKRIQSQNLILHTVQQYHADWVAEPWMLINKGVLPRDRSPVWELLLIRNILNWLYINNTAVQLSDSDKVSVAAYLLDNQNHIIPECISNTWKDDTSRNMSTPHSYPNTSRHSGRKSTKLTPSLTLAYMPDILRWWHVIQQQWPGLHQAWSNLYKLSSTVTREQVDNALSENKNQPLFRKVFDAPSDVRTRLVDSVTQMFQTEQQLPDNLVPEAKQLCQQHSNTTGNSGDIPYSSWKGAVPIWRSFVGGKTTKIQSGRSIWVADSLGMLVCMTDTALSSVLHTVNPEKYTEMQQLCQAVRDQNVMQVRESVDNIRLRTKQQFAVVNTVLLQ